MYNDFEQRKMRTSISLYSNRRAIAKLFGGCAILLSLMLCGVKYFYAHDAPLDNYRGGFILRALLPKYFQTNFWVSVIATTLLVIATMACLYRLLSSKPRVIISVEGIWRPGYDLIAWNKIESIGKVMFRDQAIVRITLGKNYEIDRWSRPRRIRMTINKRLTGAHIFLDGHLTTPHDEILAIAKNFRQLSQKTNVDN